MRSDLPLSGFCNVFLLDSKYAVQTAKIRERAALTLIFKNNQVKGYSKGEKLWVKR